MSRPGDLNNLFTMGLSGPQAIVCIAVVTPIYFIVQNITGLWSMILFFVPIAAIFMALAYAAHLYVEAENARNERRAEAARREANIIYRAGSQHTRWMRGDSSGFYGDYPPADL